MTGRRQATSTRQPQVAGLALHIPAALRRRIQMFSEQEATP